MARLRQYAYQFSFEEMWGAVLDEHLDDRARTADAAASKWTSLFCRLRPE